MAEHFQYFTNFSVIFDNFVAKISPNMGATRWRDFLQFLATF
jgi:hypothetical protein